MKNILIYTECWGVGGIERSVINLVKALGVERCRFHVFSTWGSHNFLSEELEREGAVQEILFSDGNPGLIARHVACGRAIARILSNEKFDAIHVNAMNGMELRPLQLAAAAGVPMRIAHSHNSSFGQGAKAVKSCLHRFGKKAFLSYATCRVACSEASARYLFDGENYLFLPNGVNTGEFKFNLADRLRIRSELGISSACTVLGSIGRCSFAKNPLFQIDIFAEFIKLHPDSVYLMVGSGELDEEVAAHIDNRGLRSHVLKIPAVQNTAAYYSALDLFLLPSLYEGLPYSVIEAQCSGLRVLASDCLTEQCACTPFISKLPLARTAKEWADEAREMLSDTETDDREEGYRAVERSPFSLSFYSKGVMRLYEES